MFIINYKKIFFTIACILVIASLVTIIKKGFIIGIDFTGGSVLEVSYEGERPSAELVKGYVLPEFPSAIVQQAGTDSFIIRTEPIDQATKDELLQTLSFENNIVTEKRFNTIGPTVGKQLKSKATKSIIIVSLAIILFIAFVFRKVSKPISSWAYGLVAVVVLIHDVLIPAGIFSFFNIQIDTLFIVGLLTILGVSVNDTIVVFDRIRENLETNESKHVHESFAQTVGKSIRQTFTRSIMTSVTVLLALGALWIWGPESTRTLSIAMFLGMFFGTYSSIFLASPMLVVWNNWKSSK